MEPPGSAVMSHIASNLCGRFPHLVLVSVLIASVVKVRGWL